MSSLSARDRLARAANVAAHELEVFLHRPRWKRLEWEPIADSPVERVEPSCVQFGSHLYVICGFRSLDEVLSRADLLDLRTGRWGERIDIPKTIAQTHCGVVGESDRYIYFVTGQVGPQCSHATRDCHAFDVQTRSWSPLPPLPLARYAPVTRLWNGRLHVVGGSKEDRVTPASEHWSLGATCGQATEQDWREEPPIPVAGPHRGSAVVDDELYVLASQHFDRPRIPGDPECTCDWNAPDEVFFRDCLAFNRSSGTWRRLHDIPIAVTHTEFSTFAVGQKIVVIGGLMNKRMFCDLIQVYDTVNDRWEIVGRMPWRNKGLVYGYWDGWLYVLTGQAHAGKLDATYGPLLSGGYRTRFSLE